MVTSTSEVRGFSFYVFNYFLWATLNVLLPAGAAMAAYWIAGTLHRDLTVDDLMIKVFAGADNFVVAAILLVITFFELEGHRRDSMNPHVSGIFRIIVLLLFALVIVLFAVYKMNSLSPSPNAEILAEGAFRSTLALGVACSWALVVKFALVHQERRRSSQRGSTDAT